MHWCFNKHNLDWRLINIDHREPFFNRDRAPSNVDIAGLKRDEFRQIDQPDQSKFSWKNDEKKSPTFQGLNPWKKSRVVTGKTRVGHGLVTGLHKPRGFQQTQVFGSQTQGFGSQT